VSAAYLETSFFVAVVFGEPGAARLQRILASYDRLLASDLLIAEALSAAVREGVDVDHLWPALTAVTLVLPSRSLEAEMRQALDLGRLRGADLWHVACALFVAGAAARGELAFLSRDTAQRTVARRLGFATP
jgi:predicted nucleic acid-binding protein